MLLEDDELTSEFPLGTRRFAALVQHVLRDNAHPQILRRFPKELEAETSG
jgi:hypothetical protein